MSDLFEAFLSGAARRFFAEQHFADAEDRKRAVLRASRPLAPAVWEAIHAQNTRLAPSAAREAHLAELRAGAAAVVTGQQVGLFLGPLYTVYKAASAVVIARALRAETGRPVVPIFWLQTEDHDFDEIAGASVPSALGPSLEVKIAPAPTTAVGAFSAPTTAVGAFSAPTAPVSGAHADSRVSVAHRVLGPDVEAALAAFRAELSNLPHAAEHLDALARHYRPGAGLATAFAGALAELFAPEGLVFVDPRDPALAPAIAPVHQRAIERATPIAEALMARVDALAAAGFEAPVFIRPGAPLSFFHPFGEAGPRFRLEATAQGTFACVGASDVEPETIEHLLALTRSSPLRFSTSALLRPIVEDTLLPTAVYVGGPGEIAYFAQLAPLYAALEVNMPLVVPRARFRVVEEKVRRLLERLGLTLADAARSEDELLQRARPAGAEAGPGLPPSLPDPTEVERTLLAAFRAGLEVVSPALLASGPGLDRAIEKTRASVEGSVAKLVEKYTRARLHADEARVSDVRRLRAILYPGNIPQERVYALAYFAARFGARSFLERVLTAITPFDPTPKDLACE